MKRNQIFVLLVAALLPFAVSAAERTLLELEKTIPLPNVKGGFDLMAVDIAGQRLFVNAEDNNTMEVIDLAAGKPARSVTGLNEPKWVVYRAESHTLYIANGGDGSVRVLDSDSFRTIRTFNFKEKANNLRYDARTKLLYVGVGKTFGALGIIDTSRDAVVGEIKLADYPKQFEVERTGGKIFVNVPRSNHVAVIDRSKKTVVATWPVEEKENVPMGFDEQHRRLFIGCEPGKLIVMDADSGKSVASLAISPECDGVYFDAKRKQIYISCGSGFLDVVQQIDPDHYQHAGKILTASGAATSLFVPELNRIFVAVPQKENQQAAIRAYKIN